MSASAVRLEDTNQIRKSNNARLDPISVDPSSADEKKEHEENEKTNSFSDNGVFIRL